MNNRHNLEDLMAFIAGEPLPVNEGEEAQAFFAADRVRASKVMVSALAARPTPAAAVEALHALAVLYRTLSTVDGPVHDELAELDTIVADLCQDALENLPTDPHDTAGPATQLVAVSIGNLSALAAEAILRFADDDTPWVDGDWAVLEVPAPWAEDLSFSGALSLGETAVVPGDLVAFRARVAHALNAGTDPDMAVASALSTAMDVAERVAR